MAKRKTVSFVLPIFNEEGSIPEIYRRLCAVFDQLGSYDIELIFVNDGSRDRSIELLADLSKTDKRVVVVDLSRNFGHQTAVTAGIDRSRGDAVIVMDADLQDPPELCVDMVREWENGYDVVYAKRRRRKDTVFKRFTAFAFYRVLQTLSEIDIPTDTGDFRLMSRKVADALSSMREQNRFLRGMVSFAGFRQKAIEFDRDERRFGETGYPLRKMVKFAADGILGFSTMPLRIITQVGFFFAGVSVLGIIYALIMRIFYPEITVDGWTFIVISILLTGGVQMVLVGVVGSYVGRIYREVQHRPLYFVQDEMGRDRAPRDD